MSIPASLNHPIDINTSGIAVAMVACCVALGLLSVAMAGIPLGVKLSLCLAAMVYGVYSISRYKTLAPCKVSYKNQGWQLVFTGPQAATKPCHLSACYYWSRWLLVLVVQSPKKRKYYLPIFWDTCHKDEFRRLRVIARYFLQNGEKP